MNPKVTAFCVLIGSVACHPVQDTTAPNVEQRAETPAAHWLGAWATAPQLVEDGANGVADNRPANPPGLANNTLRQIIFPTVSGSKVRLEISNRWGESPLELRAVHLATAGEGGRVVGTTDTSVTFDGKSSVLIPAHTTLWSDPTAFLLSALTKTAITIQFGDAVPHSYTGHPGSRTDSYIQNGDAVSSVELREATKTEHWYYVTKLDVETTEPQCGAIVAFGDSITDGRGSTSNGSNLDQRWPDFLARKLQASSTTRHLSVLNLGIGGNRVSGYGLGPSGIERFERDVLGQSGVKWVIILHGINDIGAEGSGAATTLIEAYQHFIERAHAAGVKVFGVPLLPFEGSAYAVVPDRVEAHGMVNAWIRSAGTFDAVIDLDAVVHDPANPTRLKASYQQDMLHPTAELYAAMGSAIDIDVFRSWDN